MRPSLDPSRVFYTSVVVLLILLGSYDTRAQEPTFEDNFKDYTIYSPNTYAFTQLSPVEVDYFSGRISPRIPLFSKKMSYLKFDMALAFIGGGGIKENDPGSTVGKGWMLVAGGTIMRHLRNVADDFKSKNYIAPPYSNDRWHGLIFGDTPPELPDGTYQDDSYTQNYRQVRDFEHDMFEFDFNGRHGRFYIGKNKEILIVDGSKLIITPVFNTSPTYPSTGGVNGSEILSFTIIDETGTKYFFEAVEKQETSGTQAVAEFEEPLKFYGKPYAAAWMVTRIESPEIGESIVFEYYERGEFDYTGIGQTVWGYGTRSNETRPIQFLREGGFDASSWDLYLKTIKFSDDTKIVFEYFDDRGDRILSKIKILNQGDRLLKSYYMNYIWWNAHGKNYLNYAQPVFSVDRKYAHLESIYQADAQGKIEPLCSFEYFLSDAINEYTAPKNGIDVWGYPNGKDNTDNLLMIPIPSSSPLSSPTKPAADRSIDLTYARMGALKRINYATGGSEEFEYESNREFAGPNQPRVGVAIGGIRIRKKTLRKDRNDSEGLTSEFLYIEPNGICSGFLGDYPVFEYTISNYGNGNQIISTDTYYTSQPLNPLSNVNGSHVGYRRVVEIVRSGTTTQGSTIREFTDLSYVQSWSEPDYFPYLPVQRPTWGVGLLRRMRQLSASGDTVRKVVNTYDIQQSYYVNENFRSLYISLASRRTYNGVPSAYVTRHKNYYPLTGRVDLLTTTETSYGPNSTPALSVTRSFSYHPVFHVKTAEETTDSKGQTLRTIVHYPFEYTPSVAFTGGMIARNMIGIPLVTEHWKVVNNFTYLLGAEADTYQTTHNGRLRPWQHFVSELTTPLQINPVFSPSSLLPSAYLLRENTVIERYDDLGRIHGYKRDHERVAIIINRSGNISARATNARYDEIAYTGFETSEFDYGHWMIDPVSINANGSKTGEKSYTGLISRTHLPRQDYRLRLWAHGSGVILVNGVSYTLSGGWQFFNLNLLQVESVTVQTNGNMIDEIVLAPVQANMATATYIPNTGVTTETDGNGQLKQYAYDTFGRLQTIRNHDNDIVKSFDYHPSVFYNIQRSQPYTSYSCPDYGSDEGVPNGTVYFVVPAEKHGSTVSQQDADSKAQYDIDQNGQDWANHNGICIPMWYNQETNRIYTKQCGTGYQGTKVAYDIPKKKYISFVSREDVNAKVDGDFRQNGQQYANDHGTCQRMLTLSSFNVSNLTGYWVVFSNFENGVFDFAIPANGGSLGQIAEGVYDVQIFKPGGGGVECSFVAGCYPNTSSGVEAHFTNVNIATGCTQVSIEAH